MNFEIADRAPLLDEPVQARIVGARPGALVTVTATWKLDEREFRSRGEFVADQRGTVRPAAQPSQAGSYVGVEPSGLWWSARCAGEMPFAAGLAPVATQLRAAVGDDVAATVIRRRQLAAGASVCRLDAAGLVGVSFRPAGRGPFSAVLVLGGSGGGLRGADRAAALLASRGVAALALAYFGLAGLPADLERIPLEYVQRASRWLLGQPYVAGPRIGLMGASRGAELALLAGAQFPEVGAVIAGAPSAVVWPGLAAPGAGSVTAWTLGGRPVPALALRAAGAWAQAVLHEPVVTAPAYRWELRDRAAVAAATIAVERTSGPIMLLSGQADAVWPSAELADIALQRAARGRFGHGIEHIRYRDAGHLCTAPPGLPAPLVSENPASGRWHAHGGTRSGNAAAQADAWLHILSFFRRSLPVPDAAVQAPSA